MAPLWNLASVLVLALAAALADAKTADGRLHGNIARRPSVPTVPAPVDGPVTSRNGTALPPYNQTYLFDQLIDHTNPSLGTFKQRFWTTAEWFEKGGPVVLFTPGEANAQPYSGYLTNRTINGQIAQELGGVTIVLEHRYYGLSNPFPDLSVKSLKFHTIQQAIDDLEYFAKTVDLPMAGGDALKPGQAPWILIGGSYSGALTSFTVVNKPNLFQAAYASSAVVESITDYWGYFEPIRQFMPQNCSADVEAVIAHIDQVFTSKNTKEIDSIKALFNMSALTHLDDVAGALRNNLWDWQSLSPSSGYGAFHAFCDALEVKNGVSAGPKGWGVAHALPAWAAHWTGGYYADLCGDQDVVSCLGTYNATQEFWTDTSIDNAGRSWTWIVCNEVGFYQEGAPINHPTLVTRLVQPAYDERQCTYWFPEAFPIGTLPVPRVDQTNKAYHGWFVNENHLFFANGHRDPWREATLAADGTNFRSTPGQPLAISDGFHCSDLSTTNGNVDATVLAVQQQALKAIAGWIAEWKPTKH
ncbi:peptidase S28 [Trametes versicolor FP-101664 SS1]|uniref:peptidase S28 n=1 Tax=Trametes versicolor (strain FP-101664) TaxID=717944 RepID=UPI00046233A2|nr:peptidase S28 [Trametes versicolor FP-101664 SS1]EIW61562.1 peptidase S28 [Trametes versicolor FP-101664 SS1]